MGEWVTVTQDIKGEWDEDIRRETQRRGEDNRGPLILGWGWENRGKQVNWGENIGTNGGTSMKRCSEKEQPSLTP